MLKIDIEIPEKFQIDIQKAVEILKREGCQEIYLFGSLVNGDYNEASDIDIAIKGLSANKFFMVMGTLMLALKTPFDLIDLDQKGNRFAQMIQKEEKLIRVA